MPTEFLLQNPEHSDQELKQEAQDLSDETEAVSDIKYGYFVPSSSDQDDHIVQLHSVPQSNAPNRGKQKCKHIIAVEYHLDPTAFSNSIESNNPDNPNRVIIGSCDCKAFEYTMTNNTPSKKPKSDGGPEAVPLEKIKNTAPAFEDLPEFGLMEYRGQEYIKKEGLLWGLHQEHPDVEISTEALVLEPERAAVKCELRKDGQLLATGHGSATPNKIIKKQLVEMAETRSINRAIRHLFSLPLTGEEVKG